MVLRSDDELAAEAARQFAEMRSSIPLETDRAKIDYVHCVATAIVEVLEPQFRDLNWDLAVFDHEAVNAFAMPGGKIVNVSTQCAELAVTNLVAYGTSKAGIHGLTKQLAIELAPLGIRVNTFAPGPVNVDRNLRDDPDYRDAWGAMIPLGRTAETGEMVGPAVFLASADSSYVTGQTFFVDGGWTVQGMVPASNVRKAAKKNK
jgi:NAD(P)-dependent dehydrogenase (short-subunit alcohol dehydrogenase family)